MSMLNRYMTSNLTWKELRHCFGDLWNHKIQHHLSVLLSPQYTLNLVCYQFFLKFGFLSDWEYISPIIYKWRARDVSKHSLWITLVSFIFEKYNFFLIYWKWTNLVILWFQRKKRNVVKMIFTFQYYFINW